MTATPLPVHPAATRAASAARSPAPVDDPRWQRGDGGWWHWPEDATEWQWRPDAPPLNPDQAAALQAQRLHHYDQAIRDFGAVERGAGWLVKGWLWFVAVIVVFYVIAQMRGPY